MKKRFRKITALLLTLALVCSLLPGTVLGANPTVNTSVSAAKQGKTLRVLAVGNSFSVDSMQYLYQMGKSAGYDLVLGNLYHAGRSLAEQWDCFQNKKKEYTYYKISDKTGGVWSSKQSTSIQYGIEDEPWDIITLQQASGVSGVPTSYYSIEQWECVKVGASISLSEQEQEETSKTEKEQSQPKTQSQSEPREDVQQPEDPAEDMAQPEEPSQPTEQAGDEMSPATEAAPEASAAGPEEEPVEPEEEPGEPEGEPADGNVQTSSAQEAEESPQTEDAPKRSRQKITCGMQAGDWGESSSVALRATAKTELTYTSSKPDVATVNEKGRVTFLSTGSTNITITAAQSEDYYGAQLQLTLTCERVDLIRNLQKKLKTHYAKCHGKKKVLFGWNITWAYAETDQWSRNDDFINYYAEYYGKDQATMYRAITDAVAKVIAPTGGFSFYIPTGTAIQNLRSSYVGDKLNRDGVHLSWSLGRYTAAMTWAAALGIDVEQITYLPTGSSAVSPLDVTAVRASVTDALQTPLAVTSSRYTTAPTLDNTEKVTLSNEAGGVRLTWKKVDNATGYRIWRKADDGSFQKVKEIVDGSTKYLDTAVQKQSGVTYTYSVRAISGSVKGPYWAYMAPANQRKTILRLSAPGETATNEKNGVKLTWKKVSGAKGYRIYREDSAGQEKLLKTVKNTVTTYTDKLAASQNGKGYTYTVQPYSDQWDGPSNGVKVVRLTGVTLKKAAKAGSGIKLTWTRNNKAKGYLLYRKMGSGKWTKVKNITKNSTLTYTDKAVKRGKTYSYRVCAYKDSSTSQLSNTKTVKR